MEEPKISQTDYRLRKMIGTLGIALPTVIWAFHDTLLASISHYYYTNGSVFFIGILFSFGLILLSYKGYDVCDEETVSDNAMTNWAGIFILITVLIPTCCNTSNDPNLVCLDDYLFGHNIPLRNVIHLVSAALFLILLGAMCIYKFTRSKTSKGQKYKRLYKICGYVVWSCVGVLALLFAIDEWTALDLDELIPGYTFVLESIALYAFAIAWLVKGDVKEDWIYLKERFL